MRILISPAKKMNRDTDSFAPEGLPAFLPETRRLLTALEALSPAQLQALWKCGDAIARENVERLRTMDLERGLTPALFAYEGIQYQYLAPGVLEREALDYVKEHLRILSGFYGLLRPMDGVTPYRLEMQAKLAVDGCRDLYAFWGERLALALAAETDLVLNLASKEYSRAVLPHLPPSVRHITCVFGEEKDGRVVEKGTMCKMARGRMVRWLAQCGGSGAEDIQSFCELGFSFSPARSTSTEFVFLKGEP